MQLGPVEGVIFSDYGTDLGSGPSVPGGFLYDWSHVSYAFKVCSLPPPPRLQPYCIYFASLGDPAGARLKPGSGYGYGFGIRVDSPLGPLRLEYAFNDKQAKRFHFGVGYRN